MAGGPLPLFLDDVVRLRKAHPCGAHEWTVVRLGADIGLRCHGCDHRVLLPRRTLEKRLKTFVQRGPGYEASLRLIAAAQAAEAVPSPLPAAPAAPAAPTAPVGAPNAGLG